MMYHGPATRGLPNVRPERTASQRVADILVGLTPEFLKEGTFRGFSGERLFSFVDGKLKKARYEARRTIIRERRVE